MKNKLILFILLYASVALAQEEKHCYTTEVYRELITNHPEVLRAQSALETFTANYIAQHNARQSGTVLIIPVVFHIIHNYGPENISEAQVYDQIRILNEDYRKLSPDTNLIVPVFKPIAADCEIEFRLATIDPNGNCTNGIDRIQSLLTYNGDDNSKLDPWPSDQYLNIWTVNNLGSSGAAAYAYYPGTAPPGADGVIAIHAYIGSIGTGGGGRSRVLTHEIGHCFNLAHVWGSTNNPGVACGDDGVSDTPITKGWTVCNLNGSICNPPNLENVQNYMEYSYCCNMFTMGQKLRMLAALNSTAGGRNNLWQSSNLIATGTDGSAAALCAPVSDFSTANVFICAGDTAHFSDLSWHGAVATRNWSFPGGTPATSTDSLPAIAYNSPGSYDVTLTVANATGSDIKTKQGFIIVGGMTPQTLPYAEGFENSFPGNASVVNADNGNTWQHVNTAGFTGTHSIMINNFSGNAAGQTDEFISPDFDFTGLAAPLLNFRLAYAQQPDTSRHDGIKVYYTVDCGRNWVLRYSKSGPGLATAPPVAAPYTPSGAGEWRQINVSIVPVSGHPDVRFKIEAISGEGNNMYIDDINLAAITADVQENNLLSSLTVSPVPVTSKAWIDLSLARPAIVSIQVEDLAGRILSTLADEKCNAGENRFALKDELPDGIYFLRAASDGHVETKKFVVIH